MGCVYEGLIGEYDEDCFDLDRKRDDPGPKRGGHALFPLGIQDYFGPGRLGDRGVDIGIGAYDYQDEFAVTRGSLHRVRQQTLPPDLKQELCETHAAALPSGRYKGCDHHCLTAR